MDLRVVDANGANPRILYRDEEVREVSFVAWSANGEQILASLRLKSGKRRLVSISEKDGSSRLLEELENGSFSGMSLSPDGRYLAFGYPTGTSGGHDIRLLELETEREIPLVEGSSNDGYPLWSLSGSQIFFPKRSEWLLVWRLGGGRRRRRAARTLPVGSEGHGAVLAARPTFGRYLPLLSSRRGFE